MRTTALKPSPSPADVYWRVEGSLLDLRAVSPVAFFTWNAHTFSERWVRRGALALTAVFRPLLYSIDRVAATRVLHALLRGVSRDRLDLLGEEYFQYVMKPRLNPAGVERLRECPAAEDGRLVLISQGLDHVMRPLAEHLGVTRLIANRLEFRDGRATGRLLDPVIRPRRGLSLLFTHNSDGRLPLDRLARDLGYSSQPDVIPVAARAARREPPVPPHPLVLFDLRKQVDELSVRQIYAGKQVLLIGATGFIGKVWLAMVLTDLPETGKIFLLIRRQRGATGVRRFEKIVEESPVFDHLHERYGAELPRFLGERIEVVEGDVTKPGLGLESEIRARLARSLDLVVNSSGLTDFDPDLREGLSGNVEAPLHVLDFVRQADHAALLHLSTCYVVGARDGRVEERLAPDYTPIGLPGFDAEREYLNLQRLIEETRARAESPAVTEELRQEALKRAPSGKALDAEELENHIARYRSRWLRTELTLTATRRARELGWPNTYTFTKNLAESLLARRGAGLPVAIVRPSIVETSIRQPFCGWNEGINTSAPLSYLLGTYFRQLPSNERKCLDLIPVDVVCRGLTLIAAALLERRHQPVYQLATSASNPCDMRRSIELTSLAHRKHYRTQDGFEFRLKAQFDAIPVSKARYQSLSAPAQRALLRTLINLSPVAIMRAPLEKRDRLLARVEKLIEIYEPFILHNEYVFEADHVELLSAALPPEERDAFGYDTRALDWWDYWINVHVPALRRWVYPLLEGRPLEARPRRAFQLPVPAGTAPPRAGGSSLSSQASWPSS